MLAARARFEETVKLVDQVGVAIRSEVPPQEIAGVSDRIAISAGGMTLTCVVNGLAGAGDADIPALGHSGTGGQAVIC
ncbi:MAG: hypothetical protein JXP73_01215 [Deltaproteobacteria bacterium]|nr:hypothetical protein [Deltaproteobacteria bacterium]